jgi:hypothetical protein
MSDFWGEFHIAMLIGVEIYDGNNSVKDFELDFHIILNM